MKNLFLVLIVALFSLNCGQGKKETTKRVKGNADILDVQLIGDKTKDAVIFIHDGPGSDNSSFVDTTAKRLANEGFYVVTYNQRGKKATKDNNYSYKKYSDVLRQIITANKLKNPVLIGHGHGGIVAMNFDNAPENRDQVKAVVLVSTPMNYLASLQNLQNACIEKYKTDEKFKDKGADLQKDLDDRMRNLVARNKSGAQLEEDLKKVLEHGQTCELDIPSKASDKSKDLRAKIRKAERGVQTGVPYQGILSDLLSQTRDYKDQVKKNQDRYFAIYGKDDKLFSKTDLEGIEKAVEPSHFQLIDEASHSVFIDQQDKFIEALKKFLK